MDRMCVFEDESCQSNDKINTISTHHSLNTQTTHFISSPLNTWNTLSLVRRRGQGQPRFKVNGLEGAD
jgi:hypothetical protein